MDNPRFSLHVWGGRGTIPVSGRSHARYGGNTSCVEVRCGSSRIVLDAGSGLKHLGDRLMQQDQSNYPIDILLSHTHIDHVLGLPFFTPCYLKGGQIRIWSGHLLPDYHLRAVISQLMSPPLFPLTVDQFAADVDFIDFMAGDPIATEGWNAAGIEITTIELSHPDRATGYRITFGGKSMCYITDYEHVPGEIDPKLAEFVRGTDCLIYDSTFTDATYERHRGWGHSTWQQAVRLANEANVGTLMIFHHDPEANDAELDIRASALEQMRPGSVMAQDGLEIDLHTPKPLVIPPSMPDSGEDALNIIERLTSVGLALSSATDLDRVLEIILVEAKELSGADGGTLYYLNDQSQLEFSIVRNDTLNISYGGTTGTPAPIPPMNLYDPQTNQPNDKALAAFAVLSRQTVNIPDVYNASGFDFEGAKAFDRQHGYETHSVLAVPMVSHTGDVLGCLQLVNARDISGKIIPFSTQRQTLMQSLASQAAVALENKSLISAQKNLLESFIQMIAQAIDAKSPYTGAHCERVPLLTNMLADAACDATDGVFKDFHLSSEEKYELKIAGWIHDCGKVTTPVHIMDKSTKLETIFDRIELVRTRFELFKATARASMLEKALEPAANRAALEAEYEVETTRLDLDFEFLANANVGGEFMSDADLLRLKEIAVYALTENEHYNLMTRKGTLTAEERSIMNDHMVHTCAMLESLPFPKHLRRVPEYAGGHHERMDGKGYPKGVLAGTMSIPARMMAVADVFEALTASDRPYKEAKKLSEAMQIIGQMKKHNHLDPDLVDFFVTSKVYMRYAERYLQPEHIDDVDEAALLAITPLPLFM